MSVNSGSPRGDPDHHHLQGQVDSLTAIVLYYQCILDLLTAERGGLVSFSKRNVAFMSTNHV